MAEWDNVPGDVPFDVPGEKFYELPDAVAPTDADKVEQDQSGFTVVPAGTHELMILGFFGSPIPTYVKATLNGQVVGYTTNNRTVKIGLASNTKCSLLFDVYHPPADPDQLAAYWHGVKDGGKAVGWHAHTLRGLIGAAIAPWLVDQPMPLMARFEKNWVGRRFVGTVDPAEPYQDNTGATKPGKPKLNARSFKPAPGQPPLVGNGPVVSPFRPKPGGPPPASQAKQAASGLVQPTEWAM